VVVITGYADQMLAQIALAHGARSFLQKPFALSELEAIVTEALTMSSAPRPTSRLG
jgi:FixJ family two-component response regulator